jgi:cellulose synthase/poly-beta-1,6-N-acetylglucosamine synthase-like glycosyltransferase
VSPGAATVGGGPLRCPSMALPLESPARHCRQEPKLIAEIALFSLSPLSLWFWMMCLIALLWLKRHRDVSIGSREHTLDESDARGARDALPTLSMLVAGKEEAANIERCLRGLLAQDYPNLQLIAINDRSEDQTGAIMERVAAEDDRLTALHVTELPDGWFGKNNAMRLGLERATGEWLCFTDADCEFDSPKLLHAAVSFALENKIEFLSVLPKLETGTFWERVIQPVAGAILVYWTPPQKVNNPRKATAYANGAFMLIHRDAYARLGGHEAVKATLNEDMHFARRAKQVGVRLHVLRGGDLYRVRMYTGFRAAWRGWSRIFYGCFGSLGKIVASSAMIIIGSLSPYISLLLSPLSGAAAAPIAMAAGFAVLAQMTVMWRFYQLSGITPILAVTYPLGAALVFAMHLNAMSKAVGVTRTTWRGTTYAGGH